MRAWYEVLEVAADADPATVKAAFRKKALAHHPDRDPDGQRFKEVNEAYGAWQATQPPVPPAEPPSQVDLERIFNEIGARLQPRPPPRRSPMVFVLAFLLLLPLLAWLLAR